MQFYLTEGDVAAGTSRAEASRSKLEELNPYVDVTLHTGKLTDDFLARFQVVVATDTSLEDQLHINGVCRANGAKFIAADVRGVSSSVFCDFGSEFVVHDKNGEALRSYMISSITKVCFLFLLWLVTLLTPPAGVSWSHHLDRGRSLRP